MVKSHNRTVFLTWAALLVVGCGARAGEQLYDATGGASDSVCKAGDTRECTGPGACRGGQQCDLDGQWGSCDCGPLGKGGQKATSTGFNGAGAGLGMAGSPIVNAAGARPGNGAGGAIPFGGANSGGIGNRGGSGAGGATAKGGSSARTSALGGASTGTTAGTTGGTTSSGATTRGGSAGAQGGATSVAGWGSGGVAGISVTSGGAATGGDATGGTTSNPNHPPVVTALYFYNSSSQTNDSLAVRVEATDLDNDPIRYQYAWTCNGVSVGSNSSQLDGSYFVRGDELRVTVTPRDSKDVGTPMTSGPIIVKNSAPYVYAPTIEPETYVDDATPLKCKPSPFDSDADNDTVTSTIHWFLNGQPYAETSDTIAASVTAPGQQWACKVTASDGIETKDSEASSVTYVGTKASGIIRSDVTWLAVNSPYFVTERLQIAAGATLKVEPGVRVLGNYGLLESWGNVAMGGTKDKPIRVENLYFMDRSTTAVPASINLSYVQFDGSFSVGDGSGALQIKHCIFGKLQQMSLFLGTELLSAAHDLEYNLFRSCSTVESYGSLTLLNNTFTCGDQLASYTQVMARNTVLANNNSFMTSDQYSPSVMIGAGAADLRNNYWGGAADAKVPECIYDNNDDLNIAAAGQYLPTLTAPHPDSPSPNLSYFE